RLAAPRGHAGGGRGARGRAPRRPEGALRAPDAGRPRPQRPAEVLRPRHRRGAGLHAPRALLPHPAHRLHRHRAPRRGRRGLRCAARDVPGRHALRCAEALGHADHRPARTGAARRLRRHRGVLRLRRRHGHGDRDPHRRHQGRHGPRPGRRGSGRRLRRYHGASRDPVEGGRRPAGRRLRRHAPPRMSAPQPAARRPRPGRRTTVLAGTAASALRAGATRPTWIDAAAPDLTGTLQQVDVPGAEAAPAVLALALVAIAASLATSLPSAWLRFVTGPVLVLTGGGAALAALGVLRDPTAAAGSAVATATGVLGSGLEAETTTWPLLTLA